MYVKKIMTRILLHVVAKMGNIQEVLLTIQSSFHVMKLQKRQKPFQQKQHLTACGVVLKYVFKASGWLLLVYSSLISNVCLRKIHNKKCVVETSGRLLFSLFIINQYCMSRIALKVSERLIFKLFIINQYSMLKMLYYKNMC